MNKDQIFRKAGLALATADTKEYIRKCICSSTQHHLKKFFESHGLIRVTGRGKFELTEKGLEFKKRFEQIGERLSEEKI